MPSGGEDPGEAGRAARVLVVDDEEAVTRTVAGRLLRGGYEVEVARIAVSAFPGDVDLAS